MINSSSSNPPSGGKFYICLEKCRTLHRHKVKYFCQGVFSRRKNMNSDSIQKKIRAVAINVWCSNAYCKSISVVSNPYYYFIIFVGLFNKESSRLLSINVCTNNRLYSFRGNSYVITTQIWVRWVLMYPWGKVWKIFWKSRIFRPSSRIVIHWERKKSWSLIL